MQRDFASDGVAAIPTARNFVMISIALTAANVGIAIECVSEFADFQSEYELS
jgi:hypothetical protein